MAWNEPGGGGNKDPWNGRGGNQGPPDLDEVVRKLQDKLGGLFGGKKPGSGGSSSNGGGGGGGGGGVFSAPTGNFSKKTVGIILGVLFVGWLASGIYIIEPAERGVVLRFGAYAYTTEPGPHWHIPYPIESVIEVNVDALESLNHKASMLTKDENIVDVELTVQSKIGSPDLYLFQDQDPKKSLRDATETEVRTTIGGSKLDFILTEGRSAIADTIMTRVQSLMDRYKTGLIVTSVNMQPAKPPEQVKEAFDDAIKAREDKERLENKAEAYANEIVPQARGAAARIVAEAKAYRDKVIAESEGETSRFSAILAEYQKAPAVTRERLYLETMEQVLGESNKVLLDVEDGNSLMYLPLDQIIKQGSGSAGQPSAVGSSPRLSQDAAAPSPQRQISRERGSR